MIRRLSKQSILRIAAISLLLNACTATAVEFGNQPDVDRLDSLEIGISTPTDVLIALGEPRGEGAAEFNPQPGRPRRIWFYEYFRTVNRDIDLTILIILFENDRYDGYWWFSSVDKMQIEQVTGAQP